MHPPSGSNCNPVPVPVDPRRISLRQGLFSSHTDFLHILPWADAVVRRDTPIPPWA